MKGATIRRQFREPRAERAAPPEPKPQGPSRVARLLALAHHVERLLEAGQLKSYADAARQLGLTRARMTQISNLLLLSPGIQGRILLGELRVTEPSLRLVHRKAGWTAQGIARQGQELQEHQPTKPQPSDANAPQDHQKQTQESK